MSLLIIAEIGANHLGSFDRAIALIDAAAVAGADAVKLQLYSPDNMVADAGYVIKSGPWAGRNLIDLYREAQTPWNWFGPLFNYARRIGIEIFSSVFDETGVDFLEELNCPRYKISSFELVDLDLIRKAASTGKPLILSTGMARNYEIVEAVKHARAAGCQHITLLKCTSGYPAEAQEADLWALRNWPRTWVDAVGISDHTPGCGVACAAAYEGATLIEKHLTLSRKAGGPDAAFSLEPNEFATLVTEVHRAACASYRRDDDPAESEKPSLALRRSLYFAEDLPAGTVLSAPHIRTARPALGLHPHYRESLYGRTLARSVKKGEPVTWQNLTECPAA